MGSASAGLVVGEQVGRAYFERIGEAPHRVQREVSFPALDGADIGAM